jgi:hypothetical protein
VEKDGLHFLQNAFASDQACLVANLKSSDRIAHSGDKGEVNEEHFIEFLTSYLPNRYTVKKAMIIDCEGNVSDSIDIVVFDRQYTPTLLDNNKHRYVPAEAVYAVFECKPTINKDYLEYTADKIQSVRKLKRTSVEIVHAGGKYPAKEHFDILGGILALQVDWVDCFGESFQKNHKTLIGKKRVDCGFAAEGASFDSIANPNNFSYSFGPKDNSLAYFAFRLLWKLQSLATVPAVDWMAYANTLSK